MANEKTKKLITAAVTGALYAALTMLLAPVSYGPVQFRASEALCVLPYFAPYTAWGLFFGCAAANLLSTAGIFDIVFGSAATLISCLVIAAVGRRGRDDVKSRVMAVLSPVIINGIIVGATLTKAMSGLSVLKNFGAFLIYAGQVALGELAVMFVLGLPLMSWLKKHPNLIDKSENEE